MKKILLIGYMGSGKTVTAKSLAAVMDLPAYDLDEVIENEQGSPIITIFETKGELYFRKIEHTALVAMLQQQAPMVLSLGGGTPCYANNHLLLDGPDVISVYLKASIDTLLSRLGNLPSGRPLVDVVDQTERKAFIAKHLFERSFFYNHANHTVCVDGKDLETVVAEIKDLLA